MTETDLNRIREGEDLSPGWVLAVGLGTVAFLLVSLAGLWWFYASMGKPEPQPIRTYPGPVLQSDPRQDLRGFLKAQSEQLESYAWVDRASGTIRIPIEEAMRMVAARGVAAFDPPPGAAVYSGPEAQAQKASDAAHGSSP